MCLKRTLILLSAATLTGCLAGEKTLHYFGDKDCEFYKDVTLTVGYPNDGESTPDIIKYAAAPRNIRSRKKDEIWNLGLEQAIHLAMANSKVIRSNGQFLSPGNRLLANPEFAQTIFDPAIQESNVLFGQRGVEAALAEFDGLFTTNMTWGRSEQISEGPNIGYAGGETAIEEFGDFRATLSKQFADGGLLSLAHNWFYSGRNSQFIGGRLFPSHYTSRSGVGQDAGLPTVGIEYRRPIWAGAGSRYTRISGPINRRPTLQSVTPVNQGVVIARIRGDISLADFEAAVQNLVKDVEDVYWELYLAYRSYDSETISRNSALGIWRREKAKFDVGGEGGGAADEAQARDNYFEIRARDESALANVYFVEARLRRLLSLPVNDGRIIRPSDEPVTGEYIPDWQTCLLDALTRRVELRRQKWNIKSLQLQLEAAKSLTHPRFDFVSRYQINGFGNRLFGNDGLAAGPGGMGPDGAYSSLFQGDHTGWGLGFEFNMPLGFRAAHAQVRNTELRLAKARAVLEAQELEISHELAAAFQTLARAYQTAQTNFNRRRAAERRVQAFEAEEERRAIDLLLRAHISLAQAEISYFTSVVEYNRGINELRYRKGTLLEDNNVHLAEGLSSPEAYSQVLRRSWSRSHAWDATKLLHTEPPEYVTYGPGQEIEIAPFDGNSDYDEDTRYESLSPSAADRKIKN